MQLECDTGNCSPSRLPMQNASGAYLLPDDHALHLGEVPVQIVTKTQCGRRGEVPESGLDGGARLRHRWSACDGVATEEHCEEVIDARSRLLAD